MIVAQQQNRIDWGEICRTPSIDALISEPCEYLITPDGYNLTPEGQRILACTVAEGAGSILFPELSSVLKSMGTAVGCDSETTGLGTSGPASSFPSQGPATSQPACGSTVTGNVTLEYNLDCQGHGLIVGDNGTTITLNGYGIYGPGADTEKVGIAVSEDNVLIKGPGIISGFSAGVWTQEARGLVITSMILQNNQIGAFFTGVDLTTVVENIIKNNNIGIAPLSSRGINIENTLMDGNAIAGVTFDNTDESVLTSNNIQGSQNGVFLDELSTGNTIQLNNAHDNVVDLNNAHGASPTINENTYSDNNCMESNPPGLWW